jgi:hypothetical protein
VRFNYVVQNYTIKDMLEFDKLKYGHITWIVLRNPYYLSCNVMPDENKNPILEMLEQVTDCPTGLRELFLKPCDETLYKRFIEYSAKLDSFRNQSLIDTLPHLVNTKGKQIYDCV